MIIDNDNDNYHYRFDTNKFAFKNFSMHALYF